LITRQKVFINVLHHTRPDIIQESGLIDIIIFEQPFTLVGDIVKVDHNNKNSLLVNLEAIEANIKHIDNVAKGRNKYYDCIYHLTYSL
jgi:hypothetical protein